MANGTRIGASASYTRKSKTTRSKAVVRKSALIEAIEEKTPNSNLTFTENMAVTNKSTKSSVLDFFGLGGALRNRQETEINDLFRKSFAEDADLAMKSLFYFRDVRGGQGERRTFRTASAWLASKTTGMSILKNFQYIPEMGRWDDFFAFVGTPLEGKAFAFLKAQLDKDVRGYLDNEKTISLLAKWLPSENTSSKKTRTLATKFRQYLGWTPRDYRQTLSDLRKKIMIIERAMSSNHWTGLDYERIPSRASMIYRKAFMKHDPDGYKSYLGAVEKGEKTIKASTLYPYDIAEKILYGGDNTKTLDLQWKALPNYVPDGGNAIVVADVSGSMEGRPMASSVSIALYFAERNTGIFKDYFMTFSGSPELIKVEGKTIQEKMRNISQANWSQNTDLQAVFNLILKRASENKISEADMPKKIFIISDMEFDSATSEISGYGARKSNRTNLQVIRDKYRLAGYKMPTLVFWNVDSRHNQTPVTVSDNGTVLASGQSPSIFKSVMESKTLTPYDLMLEVLNRERYSGIVA